MLGNYLSECVGVSLNSWIYHPHLIIKVSLFVGREFFIGITKWTNELGACAVASAFPEYPCTPIKVRKYSIISVLHI